MSLDVLHPALEARARVFPTERVVITAPLHPETSEFDEIRDIRVQVRTQTGESAAMPLTHLTRPFPGLEDSLLDASISDARRFDLLQRIATHWMRSELPVEAVRVGEDYRRPKSLYRLRIAARGGTPESCIECGRTTKAWWESHLDKHLPARPSEQQAATWSAALGDIGVDLPVARLKSLLRSTRGKLGDAKVWARVELYCQLACASFAVDRPVQAWVERGRGSSALSLGEQLRLMSEQRSGGLLQRLEEGDRALVVETIDAFRAVARGGERQSSLGLATLHPRDGRTLRDQLEQVTVGPTWSISAKIE